LHRCLPTIASSHGRRTAEHAKTSIMLDTYAHILPGFRNFAVESIGAALSG
jgi:hypothetical protein